MTMYVRISLDLKYSAKAFLPDATGGRSISKILKDAWKGEVKPTQAEDLAELVAKHGIKVTFGRANIYKAFHS